jgi:cyclopropane fatty-acyl-phospholipid synthase-like methyltransferase
MMNQENQESLDRFTERYSNGQVPWDDTLPPPEVQRLVQTLNPGRALDLGCGYGRTAIYLAQNGWQVDGIDFVPQAIAEAKQRALVAGVAKSIQFHTGSVADLNFLTGRYDLAIDIGCLHALSQPMQLHYHNGLRRLLCAEAPYLLFARLHEPEPDSGDGEERFSGLAEADVLALFADFHLENSEFGVTQGTDYSWRSGWFWFRR